MVFKFNLSSSGPSQPLFKVVYFLLQLDELILFFVKQVSVVHCSLSGGLVSDRVIDPFP